MDAADCGQAILKAGREKSLRRRHPWIFSGAIDRLDGQPSSGETVAVRDHGGRFLAWAAYSPSSQIRLRVWSFDEASAIDPAFFRARIGAAIESRRRLGMLGETSACRLVFSESDGLPGLIVDRYGAYLVCQFLAAGAEHWRSLIVELLAELVEPSGIYERSEASVRRKEGLPSRAGVLSGQTPPAQLRIEHGGGSQWVDIAHGQKTGSYLDQRLNHLHVAAYAADCEMLDAFCHTGGFAMACLARGATSATLLDASAEILRQAEQTAETNGFTSKVRVRQGDAFDELRRLSEEGQRYDLVVLDPPKFVHAADQLQAGLRGYKDINWLGMRLLRPGGVLATFSCSSHVDRESFQRTVAAAAADAGRFAQILETLSQPPDHPVALSFPEGAYLKGLLLRVS
jgi:23S rRNA (cytosine1962-C5)-methyltransferase